MLIKKYSIIVFLLLFLSSSSFSQNNIWGAEASVGVAHGEFSNPISLTPTPTNWYSMMQYNDVLSTTVYWNQNLTGVSAATSNPTPTPIGSPSQANGVAIFDGAYLLETGIASSWGFSAYLISPQIDLTGFAGEPISMKFYAMKDGGWNDTRLSFSADDGATWSTALDWTYELPAGADGWIDLDFPGSLTLGITDLTQCRLRFLSTGIPKFTLIDDLTLSVPCNDTYNNIIETAMGSYTSPSGNTWTGTGIYYDTIPNVTNCDSIITIDLTILNAQGPVYNITECNEFVSPSGNYTWNSNGTYVDTIPSAVLGDSIMTFNLTIDPSLNSNHSYSAIECDSYLSPSGNYLWSSTGIYLDTIPNAIGCDSLITVDLTVIDSHENTESITRCFEYYWPENGTTYTASGTYTASYMNQNGCDSLEILDLIIFESSSSVTQDNETLLADSISDTYSWLDCLNNYNLVNMTTEQMYIPTETGIFALVTETDGCISDTSVCFLVDYAGIESIDGSLDIRLVPNPTNDGYFTVIHKGIIEKIVLVDMLGRPISVPFNSTSGIVDASSLEPGKYIVRIESSQNVLIKQLIISK